ncbi:MAG: phosphate ABC transporter, permease protein PstA [Armatimonadetes bacterium CG2_30_59_28]|nr:phosphate ABC transporter permease PstA [Armatimonadota bacterium]OIO96988.1 MAG: phosphate ABC transporter, permease protein PstA [Armatimonadetes bacterium CG2_30_59_28]PIU64225.1 MAG: phosphate ABC transporter, permease protein PstA [Armatimonadetes bacterium CG07_land_8_20_14_0_80_59_28]PIX44294.1 MAG: phosphate ABC transporter, permease protein PstA [Armatimonadetes bacterium CG_4_8_14_3_um_filter_58_9]PIY49019.1 MAG: phosphate ABC transporter, permease protein PstA [Armatimonadetes bac
MTSRSKEKIAFAILTLTTILVTMPVILIVATIVKQGIGAINIEFLTTFPRNGMREGGIYPAIFGTLCLVAGAVVFAVPLGVGAAIYLNEYAGENLLTRLIRLAIINLAGVPSVVYGLFGMGLFVIFLNFGASILAGSLTLAVMNLPVIITASKEALSAVPQPFREVSLSLGASRWQTVRHIVLPNAVPGILTGIILEVSRAAGETAPILFTVAAFYLPGLPSSVFNQVMALPMHLFAISTQIPNISLETRYGTALVLLGLVFLVNSFAIVMRAILRRRRKW